MKKIIVVSNPKSFRIEVAGVEILSSKQYLTQPGLVKMKNVRVFNLSNDYSYQSKGYYVSLLAEARGHKPLPGVKNIQDIKAPATVKIVSGALDELIQKSFRNIKSKEFVLSVYFGKNVAKQHDALAQELHKSLQAPFFRAKFIYNKKWLLQSIRTISMNEIPSNHLPFVDQFAGEYFSRQRYHSKKEDKYLYDLAILVNPSEKEPPSDKKAIQKLVDAAEDLGFHAQLITRDDAVRIAEFDALFIRETTSVHHHTYRMARRAQQEGLVVIDDPDSILRCTNKVYLAELLVNAKIPVPPTLVVHSENKKDVERMLGLPCVLKLPDSSFSQGVVKVSTKEALETELDKMLKISDLVIAQAYTPTDFDWRIGVLDRKPLFACKYFMAKGHWQIYNWASKEKETVSGDFECVPLKAVPATILEIALKATNLIGNGLYGVDIKEINGLPSVIEVNDNPSIDDGVENQVLGDELYKTILQSIKDRIENQLINASREK